MLSERACASAAVAVVLAGQGAERAARRVVDDDLAAEVDAAAGGDQALVELGVFVRDRGGVPGADAIEDTPAIRAKENRVHVAFFFGVAVRRAADAEGASKRRAHGFLERAATPAALRAADVVGAGSFEDLHALLDVVGRVLAVDVHPHDHVAASFAQDSIQADGLDALGVVDDADPAVAAGEAADPRACHRCCLRLRSGPRRGRGVRLLEDRTSARRAR